MIVSLRVFSGTFSRTDVHFRPSQLEILRFHYGRFSLNLGLIMPVILQTGIFLPQNGVRILMNAPTKKLVRSIGNGKEISFMLDKFRNPLVQDYFH